MNTDERIARALEHPRLSPHASLHMLEAATLVLDFACPGVTIEALDAYSTTPIEYLVDQANRHTITAKVIVGKWSYFLSADCYRGKSTCDIHLSKGRVDAHDLLDLTRILEALGHLGVKIKNTMAKRYAEVQKHGQQERLGCTKPSADS